MPYTTVLLQTKTNVEGEGLNLPSPLGSVYTVPQGCTAGVQYVRAGNAADGMVNATLLKDGRAMRYFPVVAASSMHVPLPIVDELRPGTEVSVSAAGEASGPLSWTLASLR